jgi:hypothetical protein
VEPTVPSGIVSFGPGRSGLCQPFKLSGARLLHDQKPEACARPIMVTLKTRDEDPVIVGNGAYLSRPRFVKVSSDPRFKLEVF